MSARGFGLIEAVMAMAVLAIALVGIAQLQVVSVRSNHFARHATLATSLATDLVDQSGLWPYDDPRLAPAATVTSIEDTQVLNRRELGRGETVPSESRPHFGELDDGIAITGNALSLEGRTWGGLPADVDRDGSPDARRYWSVFLVDADGDGVGEGKSITVVARWKEPGLGFRQVALTSFRANPEVLAP